MFQSVTWKITDLLMCTIYIGKNCDEISNEKNGCTIKKIKYYSVQINS